MPQIYNVCKYWNESEPAYCAHWDTDNNLCKYYIDLEVVEVPSCPEIFYPFCNYLGTETNCPGYTAYGTETIQSHCILPDPNRHICNRKTGNKWVRAETEAVYDENGHIIEPYPNLTLGDITGYNSGNCNSYGTQIECAGYNPQHLGFGILQPTDEEKTFDAEQYNCCLDDVFGYRLPLDYEVLNLRARLSPCAWWSGSIHEYEVDTSIGKIAYFDTSCIFNGSEVDNFRNGGVVDNRFYYKCNGCSADCPAYTGVCWRYCVDLKLSPGDKVLAEQIHELRYYMRREKWTSELYERYFDDYEIFAWKGWAGNPTSILDNQGNAVYPVKATRVYISDFNSFTIGYEDVTLSAGTLADDQGPDYPSLIRELRAILIDPIIRNKFEQNIEGNYFESLSLMEDDEVYIFGDVFYKSETYVLNLSDPEVQGMLPVLVREYDTMFELRANVSADVYNTLQEDLNEILIKMILYFPEKLRLNLTAQEDCSFIININTYFGENEIIVFNKGSLLWGYDKIKFYKYFVGGVVKQTAFTAVGDGGYVTYLPFYEESFEATENDNVSISFKFDPVRHGYFSPPVSYIYNDYDYSMISDINHCVASIEPSYHLTGYTIYAIEYEEYILSAEEYKNLNSMYILLSLDNIYISNAILPWTCEKIEIIYSDGSACELAIAEHSFNRRLPPNQAIIYPTNTSAFRAPCSYKDTIVLTNLRTYQKRSFGQLPTVPEEASLRIVQSYSDQLILDNVELLSETAPYTVGKATHSVVAGVVFQGRSGRDVGTARTKMLSWIKQPFSPDVEIKYDWQANYKIYKNYPECFCHGRWTPKLYGAETLIREPYCGDHDKYDIFDWKSYWTGSKNRIGPMWWPYVSCDGFQAYEEITNQGYTAMEIMHEFTLQDDGEYLHGQHDLRMLGPNYMRGWQGDFCPIPSWCSCNRETFWSEKVGGRDANLFVGWAQYRSGVSATQIAKWRQDNEAFPKFGNASRPFMRSYRSIDRVQYYEMHDGCPKRRWRWMPVPMGFSELDIAYYNDDFLKPYATQVTNNVLNPMGYLLAKNIDGINISEELDTINRYKFDDVFRVRGHEDIIYPVFDGELHNSSLPWHEFRYYGMTDKSIQWAWREKWQDLERRVDISVEQILIAPTTSSIKKPFIQAEGIVKGLFICLGIDHPDYQYDMYTRERTVMTEEGVHIIKFFAPVKDEYTGEYLSWPKVQLDDGLPRYFTYTGEWDPGPLSIADPNYTEATKSKTIYRTCTQTPWLSDVTLFDNDYLDLVDDYYPTYDDIPEENRIAQTLDTEGNYTYTYFQKGLSVELYTGAFSLWPKQLIPVQEFDAYIYPDLWATTPEGMNYYLFSEDDVTFTFVFDEHNRTISRIILECKFGHEEAITDGAGNPSSDSLYHVPAIYIYAPYSETEAYLLYDEEMILASPGVHLYNRTVVCDLTVPFAYTFYGTEQVVIKLRRVPTTEELEAAGLTETAYDSYNQKVYLRELSLYEEKLVDAQETVIVHERKYYVSYGNHGNMAPQGDESNLLLAGIPKETASIYQRDSRTGITDHTNNAPDHHAIAADHHKTDMPASDGQLSFVNKCRGRFVTNIQPELEPIIDTTDVATIEEKQKEMFDKAMEFNYEDIIMDSFIHPTLIDFLGENGMSLVASPSCYLYNSYVMPLANIKHYSTYSPAGHQYVQGSYVITNCGNRSFTYEYIQREETFSEAEEVGENVVQVTTSTVYGEQQRGLGTAYIDPEHKLGPFGYLRGGINEVTKYAMGTTFILQRVEMMGILMKNIYPRYFARETTHKIYDSVLTKYTMPDSMQEFPFEYYPSNTTGWHELANVAMNDFYMYGGWHGRYMGGYGKEAQIFLDLLAGRYN